MACVVLVGSGVSLSETLGCVGPDFNLQSILNTGDTWRRMTNLIKLLSHAFNYDCKFEHWNLKVNALLGIITFV